MQQNSSRSHKVVNGKTIQNAIREATCAEESLYYNKGQAYNVSQNFYELKY
jgi:hypothetical protein